MASAYFMSSGAISSDHAARPFRRCLTARVTSPRVSASSAMDESGVADAARSLSSEERVAAD